jgi:oligoendopeptidase F
MLLDQKLQDGYIMLCNLHARYLFDKNFYEERKSGMVSRKRLDEIMLEAQKTAYAGTLAEDGCNKLFWASKLHFFLTSQPFYNFPYTFGFLFSLGIYSRALEEGKHFAEKYDALLLDSGRMNMEDLARKHLQQDITDPEFWQKIIDILIGDVNEFLSLTENKPI